MENKYFTKREILETIKEVVTDYSMSYYDELHQNGFNSDYYIIGTHKAKKALEEYGAFEAIEEVKGFEEFNFGEIYTDFSNPEKVANMLWYILGQEVVYKVLDNAGLDLNDNVNEENNQKILAIIEEMLEEEN